MEERRRPSEQGDSDIVWQTPANPPQPQDYIFLNGLRLVKPYFFQFISHVKNRWAGKTIVDLFSSEFKGRSYDYYVSAVKCGRIQVDGEIVPVSYTVRPSQTISHFVHRHEPPVRAQEILIIQEDPDVIVVCKPASIPVHPCGQYRKNTVVGILQADYGLAPLFPVHRLDRLVSGLLILSRTALKANFFRQQIEAGIVRKQYVAKVVGIFPEDEQIVNANVNYNAQEGRSTVEVCDDLGISREGKTACTKFKRVKTNGTHSIVLCEPITGRTHQIRVHLQHTGHPIANDSLYLTHHCDPRSALKSGPPVVSLVTTVEDSSVDPMCTTCPNLPPPSLPRYGGGEEEEGLWLHCVRYSGPSWNYECPHLPSWAHDIFSPHSHSLPHLFK